MRRRCQLVIVVLVGGSTALVAQQVPDRTFRASIVSPAYSHGKGPTVCLDEAHHNFHTLDDRNSAQTHDEYL